jgi:hypothetical protein
MAALVAGLLILIFPKIINYLIAFYLIVIGLHGIFFVGPSNPIS